MTKRRRKGSQGFLTTASGRDDVALGTVWEKLVYNDMVSILCIGGMIIISEVSNVSYCCRVILQFSSD